MRSKEFTFEATIGTNPKRPARTGSRPERGHEAQPRYTTNEMDKSQTPPGRDGRSSHSTYGSRDKQSDAGGKEYYGKSVTAKKFTKDALKTLNKSVKPDVAEAGVVDTIKTKAKQFGKYMTEPQSPHNNFVRDRAKNIDKIRKQKEKEQDVTEGWTKLPSGDYQNSYTGVRTSKPPQKKKRGEKTGAEWDAIEKAKQDKEQGVAEGLDEIAGAMPTPSHQQAMYKAAADSNRAMAAQEAERQRRENAARAAKLAVNMSDVDRHNNVNYSGPDAPKPSNATWDGDSSFLDLDGTQYAMASRMPISGDVPQDMKLIVTKEGRQVYIWTRYKMKGDGGHYFYPAPNPKTIKEAKSKAMDQTAKRLTDPKDGQSAKLRAAGDKKRQGQLAQRQSYGQVDEMLEELAQLAEHGKASRELCKSAKPDSELGASMLSSCKSQGLRARDGEKSHKLGKDKKSRIKVGGHRIKGQKYGGPLPDWS